MDLHSLTHLLLSISLFSFIISYSNSFSFKFYLSTLCNKNYIFLVFNGILVFLAKTSGFARTFSQAKSKPNETLRSSFQENEALAENVRVEEENHDLNLVSIEEVDDEAKGLEKGDEESFVLNLESTDKKDEEQEHNDNDSLSSEDLNKKFDEFIRRMKEEFRTEARQQLVMIY